MRGKGGGRRGCCGRGYREWAGPLHSFEEKGRQAGGQKRRWTEVTVQGKQIKR